MKEMRVIRGLLHEVSKGQIPAMEWETRLSAQPPPSVGSGASKEGRPAGGGGGGDEERRKRERAGGQGPPAPTTRAIIAAVYHPTSRDHPAVVSPHGGGGESTTLPRSAAVLIKGGEGFSYAKALQTARREIALPDLVTSGTSARRTAGGGLLVEVPGPGGSDKADALAERLVSPARSHR